MTMLVFLEKSREQPLWSPEALRIPTRTEWHQRSPSVSSPCLRRLVAGAPTLTRKFITVTKRVACMLRHFECTSDWDALRTVVVVVTVGVGYAENRSFCLIRARWSSCDVLFCCNRMALVDVRGRPKLMSPHTAIIMMATEASLRCEFQQADLATAVRFGQVHRPAYTHLPVDLINSVIRPPLLSHSTRTQQGEGNDVFRLVEAPLTASVAHSQAFMNN
jgi:hypothetical protein